jgi:hypothetical protein
MDDLAQWLREQLDVDAARARACPGNGEWTAEDIAVYGPDLSPEVRAHMAEHDPRRVLREVEAKRRTLDRHTPHSMGGCRVCEAPHWGVQVCNHCYGKAWPCPDILDFATVYADRPGYREAWRP